MKVDFPPIVPGRDLPSVVITAIITNGVSAEVFPAIQVFDGDQVVVRTDAKGLARVEVRQQDVPFKVDG
jgi:hypothetical protein